MAQRRSGSSRRRATAQATKFGEEVRTGRSALAMSIHDAARHAGVSWQTVARVEAGDPAVSVLTACAVAESVGVDLVLRGYPGKPPSLRDSGQLAIAEHLRALAHPSWQAHFELPVGEHGEAIDAVFFGPTEIAAVEIERLLIDWQAQFRRADEKRAILAAQHQRPVRLIICVEDTPRNRRIVAAHSAVTGQMLPAGTRETLNAFRSGRPIGRDALVWVRRRRA